MSASGLRCRVCETVSRPEPVDACRRCDGPTDLTYDWDLIGRDVSHRSIAAGPESIWRYGGLLPAVARVEHGAGWTPLVRADRLSDLLGLELHLKLEGHNPTQSYKDRIATIAAATALDHGVTTLCCSSTGNLGHAVAAAAAATGLEAIVLAPVGGEAAAVAARHPGARVFAVTGTYDDCRRLELELGGLFPWGFVSGNLHPYASEGAKTISFEIAEQLGWQLPDAVVCPAASGTLFSKLAQGFAELARAGLAAEPVPRMFAAQALGSSPIAAAFADDRGISRVEAVDRRRVAGRRRSVSRRSGDRRRARDRRRHRRRRRGRDRGEHRAARRHDRHRSRLRERRRARCARPGRARGEIAPGSRVVLVVTGARPQPVESDVAQLTTITPDADAVLSALGLRS